MSNVRRGVSMYLHVSVEAQMRTVVWRIVDYCNDEIVLFPVAAIRRGVLIMTLPAMREIDRNNIRRRLVPVGLGEIVVFLLITNS